MKISDNGLNLIKKFEGCRLTAYQDAVGVWTIGYGTTNADKAITGTTICQGLKISQATADDWLRQSVDKKYGPKVDKYSAYNWTQPEFDALVSFAYNIGSIDGLTAKGTRTRSEIAAKFLEYNKAGGNSTVIHLPDEGITGNSHFMFQELNNEEIADHIYNWLEKHNLG